ncbi:MAG: Zn-ribbon domain-containing OB-fold protein [Sulfobacillus sp.]
MMNTKRPLPRPDEDSEVFWEGCRAGELRMQECSECHTLRFRPRPVCPECLSDQFKWTPVSGKGRVYTFGVVRSGVLPSFREEVPYVLALIDLEEGPRMTSRIVGCEPESVEIGMSVRVLFEALDDTISVPYFRPQ